MLALTAGPAGVQGGKRMERGIESRGVPDRRASVRHQAMQDSGRQCFGLSETVHASAAARVSAWQFVRWGRHSLRVFSVC